MKARGRDDQRRYQGDRERHDERRQILGEYGLVVPEGEIAAQLVGPHLPETQGQEVRERRHKYAQGKQPSRAPSGSSAWFGTSRDLPSEHLRRASRPPWGKPVQGEPGVRSRRRPEDRSCLQECFPPFEYLVERDEIAFGFYGPDRRHAAAPRCPETVDIVIGVERPRPLVQQRNGRRHRHGRAVHVGRLRLGLWRNRMVGDGEGKVEIGRLP